MVPTCMVNEETLSQVPEDVRQYLRALRRRIIELEPTDAPQRLAQLEDANRKLQVQVEELLAWARRQQEQIRQLQQQLADTTAKLNTHSSNSSWPLRRTVFTASGARPRRRTSPARTAGGSRAIPGDNASWSGPTRFAKPSPANPLPVAVAASP